MATFTFSPIFIFLKLLNCLTFHHIYITHYSYPYEQYKSDHPTTEKWYAHFFPRNSSKHRQSNLNLWVKDMYMRTNSWSLLQCQSRIPQHIKIDTYMNKFHIILRVANKLQQHLICTLHLPFGFKFNKRIAAWGTSYCKKSNKKVIKVNPHSITLSKRTIFHC